MRSILILNVVVMRKSNAQLDSDPEEAPRLLAEKLGQNWEILSATQVSTAESAAVQYVIAEPIITGKAISEEVK